ncbi:sigma 54-interacting transcriptional regulator [Allopusillimonas ginsengisoli]|nr:hypothetical protein D7I39_09200 [Allopusillimonas ginsengisoli]
MDGPLWDINCGGLLRDLLVAEQYGYRDGAFTGARKGLHPHARDVAA